jgi:hypothetical protein
LEGVLVDRKRIERSAGAALLLKYHGKRVNGEAPEVVACNSLSTGSSLSGCSVETGVKNDELRMQPTGFFCWKRAWKGKS